MSQPDTIARYKILRKLGQGGMGSVYLGYDPAIDRQVAIKTITISTLGESSQQQEHRQRFLQEAQAAGRLQHPNIISVYDVGTFGDGSLFIVMEYLPGMTLEAFTEKKELLPVPWVISMISDACMALDYAHHNKIIHRDVKPSNLMLVDGERVKITDFGIAKDHRANITECGMLLGTPNYMSPEQAMGKELDGRSDLFSMGVVLFELLTGQRPFQGDSVSTVLYQLVHGDPTPPHTLDHTLPETFDGLLRVALHKTPESRFQTGWEMASALRNHMRFQASPMETQVLRMEDLPPAQPDPIRPAAPSPEQTLVVPTNQSVQTSTVAGPHQTRSSQPTPSQPAPQQPAPQQPTPPQAGVHPLRQRILVIALMGLCVALGALIVPQDHASWLRTIVPRLLSPRPLSANIVPDAGFPEPDIPASQPVELKLIADRPDARFYVDGVALEDEVLSWRPALAGQVLSATNGCFRGEVALDTPSSATGSLRIGLSQAVVRTVALRSEPAGANVLLNGNKLEGSTPLSMRLPVCEDHEVTLSLAGHHERTLSLPSGGDWDEMTGALLRLEAQPDGRVVFDAAYPVTILRDGTRVGRSGEMLELSPGKHELTFENKEYRVSVTETVTVKSGEKRILDAPVPSLGTVRVLAYPGNALILVDGVDVEPPPAVVKLGAGEHRVECRWNVGDGKTAVKTVLVLGGQTQSLHFRDDADTDGRR